LAFDSIAAVAGIPDEGVVTRAHRCFIVTAAADNEIVAVATDQRVIAVTAGDRIVARAAVERELDFPGQAVARGNFAVAAKSVEDEVLGAADVDRERGWVYAVEADACAVCVDGEILGETAAVNFDSIVAGAAF